VVTLPVSGEVSGAHVVVLLASFVAEAGTMLVGAALFLALRVENAALVVGQAARAQALAVICSAIVFALVVPAAAQFVAVGVPGGLDGAVPSAAVVASALPPARGCDLDDVTVSQAHAVQIQSTSFVARPEATNDRMLHNRNTPRCDRSGRR